MSQLFFRPIGPISIKTIGEYFNRIKEIKYEAEFDELVVDMSNVTTIDHYGNKMINDLVSHCADRKKDTRVINRKCVKSNEPD